MYVMVYRYYTIPTNHLKQNMIHMICVVFILNSTDAIHRSTSKCGVK